MTHHVVGSCPKCGAPVYAPLDWNAIIPPPSIPSCACNPRAAHQTTTTTTVILNQKQEEP